MGSTSGARGLRKILSMREVVMKGIKTRLFPFPLSLAHGYSFSVSTSYLTYLSYFLCDYVPLTKKESLESLK